MDISDVERLDSIVAVGAGERWHGGILISGQNDGEPYNLLVQGPVVRFYKLTTGNVQSRQATEGISIPTTYPAIVDEWSRVLMQLEQWVFEGNSPISLLKDKTNRNLLINKVLQCPRGIIYKPKQHQQFDGNGVREGICLHGIRQQRKNHKITRQKRSKAECEPSERPTKRVCECYEHEIDYRLWDIESSKSLKKIYI
jgi:hypothetical protein